MASVVASVELCQNTVLSVLSFDVEEGWSRIMKIARILELLVGVAFLYAAATKAYDMRGFSIQIRGYGIIPGSPDTHMAMAWVMTIIEAVIGAALIAGLHLRGMVLVATAVLLVGFTGLIAWGWAFHGLEDCGCFGTSIQMTPEQSIAKNIVLLFMTGFSWFKLHKASPEVDRKLRSPGLAFAGAGLAAVFAATLLGNKPVTPDYEAPTNISEEVLKDQPFAKFVFPKDDGSERNLGTGTYVVPVLNATCDHCRDSVPHLNEAMQTPEYPDIVALVVANDDAEMDEFQAITSPQFETYVIGMLDMLELVKEGAPPVFYHVLDGAEAGYLQADELTVDDLLELAGSGE